MLTGADLAVWALVAGLPVLAFALWRGRPPWPRALSLTALTFYLAALIGLAFGGIPIDRSLLDDLGRFQGLGRFNLMPFWFVDNLIRDPSWKVLLLVIGNVALFAPLGYLLPVLWNRYQRLRAVAVAGFLTSLTIELTQLGISSLLSHSYRLFELDDLILNTAGAVLGWALWRALRAPRAVAVGPTT